MHLIGYKLTSFYYSGLRGLPYILGEHFLLRFGSWNALGEHLGVLLLFLGFFSDAEFSGVSFKRSEFLDV